MTKSESPTSNKYRLITRRIDQNVIHRKTRKEIEVSTTIVKNVNINFDNAFRSGAIIYTHYKGKTYFCLGIDSMYGDLTDFSGGVKQEENVIQGGLRELKEESQGVFGDLKYNDVKECLTFYTNNMLTMFIRLDVDMDTVKQDFRNNIRNRDNDYLEVSNIVWIDTNEFLDSILGKGRILYSRVRRMLYKVTDIIKAL